MRKGASISKTRLFGILLAFLAALTISCLPQPASESGGINLTVYGFSIMKESLEKSIYPGFAAKWKRTRAGSAFHFIIRRFRNDHQPNPAGRQSRHRDTLHRT